MSNPLDRRTVLRGLGTAIALPMLDAMMPLTAVAARMAKTKPNRMAFLFVPNGINMAHWTPAKEGALVLPHILQPLSGVQSKISVLSGLAQYNANALGDGPGDHARSAAVFLTGVKPVKTAGSDIRVGQSVDQLAAHAIGSQTRFASLEIGCERGGFAGDCDSGYSCAYSSSISWRTATTPMAKEVNPRLVFERLFGSGDRNSSSVHGIKDSQRNSILDFVLEDARALKNQLGPRDNRKLDEYLEGVREIEKRLARMESATATLPGGARPSGIPSDYGEHLRLMGDMMILAFRADLTRICTFMFANEGSNRSYVPIGVPEGHHDISHHGNDPHKLEAKLKIDRFHVEQLAYILNKMDSIQEADGTLLDNTMLLYGGGISDGNRHNHDDLPILFAGRGGGSIQTGKHIAYANDLPLNNLYLAMLERVGIRTDKLGDSTGKLSPLF
jgi:hypothetical protein